MKSYIVALSLGAALVAAQDDFKDDYVKCEGQSRPDWEDCEQVMSDFNFNDSGEVAHTYDPSQECMNWWSNEGNCRISHCFADANTEGETRNGGEIYAYFLNVKKACDGPFRAGGTFWPGWGEEYLEVLANEDAPLPAKRTLDARKKHSVASPMSRIEYEELRNDTSAAGAQPAKRSLTHVRDDETYTTNMIAENVRQPDVYDLGPRLKKGVSYEYKVSESHEFSVSVSTEFGAAFDIFTASMGMEMSQTDTYSIEEGLTFDVDCENQGQVYFYPLFNYYDVTFSNGQDAEFWIPQTSGENIDGEITVVCQG